MGGRWRSRVGVGNATAGVWYSPPFAADPAAPPDAPGGGPGCGVVFGSQRAGWPPLWLAVAVAVADVDVGVDDGALVPGCAVNRLSTHTAPCAPPVTAPTPA